MRESSQGEGDGSDGMDVFTISQSKIGDTIRNACAARAIDFVLYCLFTFGNG